MSTKAVLALLTIFLPTAALSSNLDLLPEKLVCFLEKMCEPNGTCTEFASSEEFPSSLMKTDGKWFLDIAGEWKGIEVLLAANETALRALIETTAVPEDGWTVEPRMGLGFIPELSNDGIRLVGYALPRISGDDIGYINQYFECREEIS